MGVFMKKLVCVLILVLFALTSAFFISCKKETNTDQSQTEQPSDTTDSTQKGDDDQGGDSTEMTREEISTTYKTIASKAYEKLNFTKTDTTVFKTKANAFSMTSLPEIGVEIDINSKDQKLVKANAISMVAMIEFVGNLYANSDFTITDKIVSFTVTMSMGSTEVATSLSILPVIDRENNRVYIEMTLEQNNTKTYYVFDLGFDFSTSTLNSMALGVFGIGANGDFEYMNCQRMDGDKFYLTTTGTDEYNAQAKQLYSDFTARLEEGIKLTADFNTEFNAYQQISQKAFNDAANDNN